MEKYVGDGVSVPKISGKFVLISSGSTIGLMVDDAIFALISRAIKRRAIVGLDIAIFFFEDDDTFLKKLRD